MRLAGTNESEGRKIIKDSGLPIISADTLAEAAHDNRAQKPGTVHVHPNGRHVYVANRARAWKSIAPR